MTLPRKLSVLTLASTLALGCAPEEPEVSFKNDIQPILQTNCIACHTPPDGEGYKKSGLQMDTHENLMKGTTFGPVIKAGDSVSSTLIRLVEGKADPSIAMPHGGNPLAEEDKKILKAWVDQGAKNN